MKTSTLEKNITKFVKKFGIRRALQNDTFLYRGRTVYFTIWHHQEDDLFIDFCNKKYDTDLTAWSFVFCILHEIGHFQTISQLTKEQLAYEYLMRDMGIDNNIYFNLPAEDLANKWALEYLETHPQECWKFQNKCLNIIRHLYKKHHLL